MPGRVLTTETASIGVRIDLLILTGRRGGGGVGDPEGSGKSCKGRLGDFLVI